MTSLLKEFVNQTDLKKSDGSDAGKTDVSGKAPATDVKFSLMRNTINADGKVTGSDVANYLEKAHDINDEVDTVLYGLETSDGDVVKVYVNATQADAFEAEMKKLLGMEDDIEEAINDLATRFDIVDVVWPKGTGPDGEGEGPNASDADDDLDLDQSADLGDPANADDGPVTDPDAEAEEDDDMEVIASADDAGQPTDDEGSPDKKKPAPKKRADGEEAEPEAGADEEAEDAAEDDAEAKKIAKKVVKKLDAKDGDKHSKLKSVGKGLKGGEKTGVTEAADPHYDKYFIKHANPKLKSGFNYFGPYLSAAEAKKEMEAGDEVVWEDDHGNFHPLSEAKLREAKLQVGWYVYDKDDKTVAGPVEEEEAKRICKEKGGDAKGFVTGYVSDYDARRANETQGDNQMTIGNKFLQRVLGESKVTEAEDRDIDGVQDGVAIPMDTQQRVLANKLKWRLPKQIVQLFAMVGIPGIKLNSAGAEASIAEAAEMLREQLSVRRAFLDFFKAFAAVKGYDIKAKVEESLQLDEAKLKRGNATQKLLETVLVKLGLPEDLVSTTGPGVVGTALYRASKDVEENSDLKQKLRMLAIRMKITPADAMAPLADEPVVEGSGTAYELVGAALDAAAAKKLIGALKTAFGGATLVNSDDKVTRIRVFSKDGVSAAAVKNAAGDWVKTVKVARMSEGLEEAVDPMGADMYADAVMNLVGVLGVPDTAFNRQARTILAKEFRTMRGDTNVGALLALIKRFTAQFETAKARVTRQAPAGTQGTV